jgi:hypothetical protein
MKIVPKFTEEDKQTLEFVGKPLFVQKVKREHKFANLKIGDACTIWQERVSYRVKLIKKTPINKGLFFGLMFELS